MANLNSDARHNDEETTRADVDLWAVHNIFLVFTAQNRKLKDTHVRN
jgi:hypothetical protein